MLRQSAIEKTGLMDENFFLYYEDVDLCLRIRKAGWRISYTPESTITHIGGRSTAQTSVKGDFMASRGLMVYLRKHKGRLATAIFAIIFKPAFLVGQITNIFSGFIAYCVFTLFYNQKKRPKSLVKLRRSMTFLGKYSWEFIFKI